MAERERDGQVYISIVAPMYNEEQSCASFFEAVCPILESITQRFEIICINDGSTDQTFEKLTYWRSLEPRIKILNLSRNFGKEAAMMAGIDYAEGDVVIPMDADLQDPPELLHDMIAKWREGFQVVLAHRSDRSSDTFLKRVSSNLFYDIFASLAKPAIPKNVGDFRLMDRVVVDALSQLPERSRFMKGLFSWVGFRTTTIEYVRPERHAGQTSFNYRKLWSFALDGLVSFTSLPLKIWSYIGGVISLIAIGYMLVILTKTIIFGIDVPGYASLMSAILFFNGIIILGLGVIGEYLARIFQEVKGRPVYLVNERLGFEADTPSRTATDETRLTGKP